MKNPKYIVNEYVGGHFEYITPCPFGIQGKYTNEILYVGRALLASDASTSEVSTKKMVSYLVESNSFKSAAYLHSS